METIVWIFFVIIMLGGIFTSGDTEAVLTLIGIAVVIGLIWFAKRSMRLNHEKNIQKNMEAARRREAEKERRRKETVRQRGINRFRTSAFASTVIRDFKSRNWRDLDYTRKGCNVYPDKIVTPYKTYTYINYGLANLDMAGCEELAEYLGTAYGRPYTTEAETKYYGGVSNSYTSYLGSDGSISTVRDAWGDERTIGYRLYSQNTVPPPTPKGRNW